MAFTVSGISEAIAEARGKNKFVKSREKYWKDKKSLGGLRKTLGSGEAKDEAVEALYEEEKKN